MGVHKKEVLNKNETPRLKKGFENDNIFSPVVKHTSIRVLLAFVAQFDMELEQVDVKMISFMVVWGKKFT